jgi:hypothetical protein
VDSEGVAWVSGQGYLRGYWTEGSHKDPITGQTLTATPTMPVLYGGGKVPSQGGDGGPTDLGRFMHNAERPGAGTLIYAAEENITSCDAGSGDFVISSLEGALDTDATGTLETVGTWSPREQEGEGDGSCSAHWFTMRDKLVAEGFYAQGTRFLDVRDPKTPVQVAYFRPDDGVAWASYFHGDYVYVADNNRGVDILRLERDATAAPPVRAGGSGATCDAGAPAAHFSARGARLSRRAASLRGVTAEACGRAMRVEVALARASAGRCRFLKGRSLGGARSCERPVWRRARGTSKWRTTLRGRLGRGSFYVFARARDVKGVAGPVERARLVAGRKGRARLVREVTAPPKDRK